MEAGPLERGAVAPRFRRILIVKLSALGDIVHSLPVVDFLARAAHGAEVDWAVDHRFAAVLEGNPGLRRVIPLDIRRWRREWTTEEARREMSGAVRALRAGGYDAAFDIQGNAKSGVITRLSGASLRFGFDGDGVREKPNLLFTNRKVPLRPEDRHVSQKYLRVVSAPFGASFDLSRLRAVIAIPPEVEESAEGILADLLPGSFPRVAVHAGTTWRTKKMDPAFWAAVVERLRMRFPRLGVCLSWGSGEEKIEAGEIRERAGGRVVLLPRTTLKELAAVFRACGFAMAPDTGPLHVAAAAGTKTVSVFRATDGNRNAPYGPNHRFLQAPLPCTACLKKRCDRDAECRESILPEAVAKRMAELVVGGY